MKHTLFVLFIVFFTVNCGREYEKVETLQEWGIDLDEIVSNATESTNLEKRNGLVFAINQQHPYTGWEKDLMKDGRWLRRLISYKDGERNGLVITWHSDGQIKRYETYREGQKVNKVTISKTNPGGSSGSSTGSPDMDAPETLDKFDEEIFNLDDKVTLEKILAEAIDGSLLKIDDRSKKGKPLPEDILFLLNGSPFSGWRKEMRGNGQIDALSKIKYGKLNGPHAEWHLNGKISTQINLKDGKKDGRFTSWHNNGRKSSETNWKKGKKNGLWTTWFDNGQKKGEENWKDGKEDGLWITWGENGKMYSKSNYKDGKKNGLVTLWYKNGQKKSEGNFKDKKIDGLYNTWFDNGQIESEGKWKDGKREDGLVTAWYKNGQKKSEGKFKDGKLISGAVWKPNGEKCPDTNIVNGKGVRVNYNDDGTEQFRISL
jgi:antitoxin component YwqK of YwqJK toxin-antitoxin module